MGVDQQSLNQSNIIGLQSLLFEQLNAVDCNHRFIICKIERLFITCLTVEPSFEIISASIKTILSISSPCLTAEAQPTQKRPIYGSLFPGLRHIAKIDGDDKSLLPDSKLREQGSYLKLAY